MQLTFSQLLKKIRTERGLTQQELVDLLRDSETEFSKIDLTTFSRWERGVTSPKLSKRLLVARVLDEDILQLIDSEVTVKEKDKLHFEKMTNRTLHPYARPLIAFSYYSNGALREQDRLCENLSRFHQDYMGIFIGGEDIQQSKMVLNTFTDLSDILVGHLLYGFVPTELQTLSLNPSQLSDYPFIDPEKSIKKDLDMYVISTFASLPKPRIVSIWLILDILKKNINIKNLVLNCHDQEAYSLIETSTEHELLSKGDEVALGGINISGKHYKYVQIRVKTESILALKVVAKFLPFTRKYILSLLE